MGKTTIEWTDRSINPIRARDPGTGAAGHHCEKVSPGCANCYASAFQRRFGLPEFAGPSRRAKVEVFLDTSRFQEVLCRKKPTKWFWCDMSDLFGEWVPDAWVDQCFAVMALTPQHTHQILTKRPERMAAYCCAAGDALRSRIDDTCGQFVDGCRFKGDLPPWPLPNVWLGFSVENQKYADERIPRLLACPAAVRFISAEPLLGPVRLDRCAPYILGGDDSNPGIVNAFNGLSWHPETVRVAPFEQAAPEGIQWVIAGGESGPKARPMHPDWARSLRDQCQAAGVPFFFKQWGSWLELGHGEPDRTLVDSSPEYRERAALADGFLAADGDFHGSIDAIRPHVPYRGMRRVGKKSAGRLLDGREHSAFPEVPR